MKRLSSVLILGLALMAAPAALAADTYKIDPVHTSLYFRIMHLDIAWVHGRFNQVEGAFVIDGKDPAKNSAEITVKAANVDTAVKKRDDHLRSPDFFHAEKHPLITFKSTAFEKAGGNTLRVSGDLTLLGVTRPVTFTVEKTGEADDPWDNHRMGFHSTFTVKRSDYGMDKMLDLVGDEAEVTFSVEGIRE